MQEPTLVDDELYHYGVLGMRWGVRRARYKQSKNTRLTTKAIDYDKKKQLSCPKKQKKRMPTWI